MDKKILEVLTKKGYITKIGVKAENYKDVDDLIKKGVITMPGAKSAIEKLLASLDVKVEDAVDPIDPVVDPIDPVDPIVENDTDIVVDDLVDEPVADEPVVDEPIVEETPKKTSKKS